MKKRLIALRGKSGVGKSTSIHILYRLLLEGPGAKTLSFEKYGRLLDFRAIVELHGFKIGIVNRGDVADKLNDYISMLAAESCQVIVCAARTKGDVTGVLASYSRRFVLTELAKTESDDKIAPVSDLAAAHQLAAHVYGSLFD
ncbi:hypothetical protein [Pseudoxanthomonas sp. SE1]|uniref:hypothetical protein n=1 Tax=Pseudoxanthomonas sp. SE1 TaxID=1664560 RepID=UPI00240DF512|nr:hypothetical protein [Pseudoxanthomonas sp. SE1]WFC40816.1 hypothetical protein OY559_13480 [Pseudoxanthomonas sp. SE1]